MSAVMMPRAPNDKVGRSLAWRGPSTSKSASPRMRSPWARTIASSDGDPASSSPSMMTRMFEVSGMFAASSASTADRNATIGDLSSDEDRP
jgi:hypothetical protein